MGLFEFVNIIEPVWCLFFRDKKIIRNILVVYLILRYVKIILHFYGL